MAMPAINGLLNYHIKGDEALLYLGCSRYTQAGFGVELHPGTPEHMKEILKFVPAGSSSTAHLPYSVVLDHDDTDRICDFVAEGGDIIGGYVMHDSAYYRENSEHGVELISKLSNKLDGKTNGVVFLEYAAGLPFDLYYSIAEKITSLPNIGICIDIGHISIKAIAEELSKVLPEQDQRALRPGGDLTYDKYKLVAQAVHDGRGKALKLIESLAKIANFVHFHLHDGHPLSTFSPYGVRDHIPFFWEIPTQLREVGAVGGLYGVTGLRRVLQIAIANISVEKLSLTLEIHPQPGQKDIAAENMEYFAEWRDLTNAKAMNFWMDLVIQNCLIVRDLCTEMDKNNRG